MTARPFLRRWSHGWVEGLAVLGSLLACRAEFAGEETSSEDPIASCEECEALQCTNQADTCEGNPACAECVAAPFGLACYGEDDFRSLASCSCGQCSAECDYMCPGGFNACAACGIDRCSAEAAPCSEDVACAPCFNDPLAEGCQENAEFQAFLACGCEECGQECIWTCPAAYSACNGCGLSNCSSEYSDCLGDPVCTACSENPLIEDCYENEAALAALACVCDHCEPECGVIYACDDLPDAG